MKRSVRLSLVVLLAALGGCSVEKMAVDAIGNSMVGGGAGGAFAADEDPDLIREALPFGLKTFESMLSVSPQNLGLLQASAQGFTGYAFLLQLEADRIDATDPANARAALDRARRLYLRGRDYALRGVEKRHPGFVARFRRDPRTAIAATTTADAPLLYWAGAAWAAAIGAGPIDLELVAELPYAIALVARVLQLDPGFDAGAADEFFITVEASRPGGDLAAARAHYRRAVELSKGRKAGPHVALAESVVVREQNRAEFEALLEMARTVDIRAAPEHRLANAIALRRATALQARIASLFIDFE
ncbi:MAG TPA: TRAP transporter TatT component family protein [Alphaproteobacteria bacterium]|nr:TRAP transporter TatT component family protein [Alphaproteobacteria bacterium]